MSMDLIQIFKEDIQSYNDEFTEELNILKVQFLKKSNKLKVIIKSNTEITSTKKDIIKKMIQKQLGIYVNVELIIFKDISDLTLKQITKEYWIDLINTIVIDVPVCKECLKNSVTEVNDDSISIYMGNEFLCKLLKTKKIENLIKTNINDMFGMKCNVLLKYDEKLGINENTADLEIQNENIIKNIMQNKDVQKIQRSPNKETKKSNSYNYFAKSDTKNDNNSIIYGKNINEEITKIEEINDMSGVVALRGDIFKAEIKETKTGKKIVIFCITDYTSSITVKCFPRPKDEEKILENIKVGIYCKIRGEATYDQYAKQVVIMARDIIKCTKVERMDSSKEKRVELHLHTQMSAMDGISPATKLIQRAAKWGHKAIAITDHGVVQAYPEAMDAAKKNNIKAIYGVEAYLVDDGVPIALNCNDRSIDSEFVVFDIETTGLSSENDKIIEIGAIRVINGEKKERFSEFVNPERIIPSKITDLTSITNYMVKEAKTIDSILPKFLDFVGDSILVAHNAKFDTSFIKKNCYTFKLNFNYPIFDTIPLCKFLYPELKKYKLDTVAKHLGISLENHHRAVDDADATAEILIHSLKILKERNINDINQLNQEYLKHQNFKTQPTFHLIILVKNQIGLKNLYKLISFSHLDYFYKKPRMLKSLIMQYKEGLIIGSACEAGQVYRDVLLGKTNDEFKNLIEFYDYLEIQPNGNNNFLIRNGSVKDITELCNINKRICEIGEKYHKPVVATGDVHFLDPNDEVYRRILMSGLGFSDADEQAPLYLKTTQEMLEEFSYLGEQKSYEVVVENTQKIADSIGDVKPIPDETFTPKIEGAEEDIKNMTLKKAHDIYGEVLPDIVQKRLDKELNSIINHGYAVLYLIAQKLVAKSLSDGYLVGSRGSVGSSFVATMSGITEVNGLPPHYVCPKCKHSEFFLDGSIRSGADLPNKSCPDCNTVMKRDGDDIPFETFLGFEGDKEPDIDLNFSGEYQSTVHKYTEVLFGKGYVFKAGTIGTIAEKTAFGFVKKYLTQKNMIVPQAEIDRLTAGCSGIKRTTGQHPGGVMVVPKDNDIFNFTPIQHPANDSTSDVITTHFDYHSISGRLLKLDILGHDDPTVLRMLQDLTGLDPKSIPLGDAKVMSLFTSPDALGVTKDELGCEVGTYGLPEFGTKFVRQMLLDTKPTSFADLVRISGLSHGTDVWINNAQYYIKEGLTTLKDCISTRDDIMIYLIQKGLPPKIAFTIMEKVRKGKGLSEEHENIMKENKIPDWYIDSCKKIKYMFPKGHAVAYVMMAVRIAYFKVYYPKAYYATYFTVRADDFDANLIIKGEDAISKKTKEINDLGNTLTQKDKGLLTVLELSYEMYKRGIKFLKIDIYSSDPLKFTLENEGIRLPISSLNGVGENAAKSIIEARSSGVFISKEDLRIRSKVSKSVVETLANHGCLDGLPETNQLSLF